MKLRDFLGLLAVSGITWGGGDGDAVITVGLAIDILGDDFSRNEFFAGNFEADSGEELLRFCGSVLDFSLSGETAGERVILSVRLRMFVLLLDLPNDFMGVEADAAPSAAVVVNCCPSAIFCCCC